MEKLQQLIDTMAWLLPIIMILVIWESIWKLIALWKSARNNDLTWFIFIAVFNTIGILPIIYILTHKNKTESVSNQN